MTKQNAAFALLAFVLLVAGVLCYLGKVDTQLMAGVLTASIFIVRSILVEGKNDPPPVEVPSSKRPSDPPKSSAAFSTSSLPPLLALIGGASIWKILPLAAALGLGGCGLGCSTVCGQIEAQVPQLNAKLADAQRAIAEVEKAGIRERLSGKQLKVFDDALSKVKEGHSLAVQSVALAEDACKDPRPYLDMIVTGWDVVRTFLALVGGEGTPEIADPILWKEAQ